MRNATTKHAIAAATLAALMAQAGCASWHRLPPDPGQEVHAALAEHRPLWKQGELRGDTVVVARVESDRSYAERPDRDPNWVQHWHCITCRVLTVERGQWPATQLRFICVDFWPTAESGILLDKLPWPYRLGYVYAFSLDTRVEPARIIAQRRRSLPPPRANAKSAQKRGAEKTSGDKSTPTLGS